LILDVLPINVSQACQKFNSAQPVGVVSAFVLVGIREAVEAVAQPLIFDVGVPSFAGWIVRPGLFVNKPLKPMGVEKLFP